MFDFVWQRFRVQGLWLRVQGLWSRVSGIHLYPIPITLHLYVVPVTLYPVYFLFWYNTGFSSSSLYIFICLYTFMNLSPLSISVSKSSIAVDKSVLCSSKILSFAWHLSRCS